MKLEVRSAASFLTNLLRLGNSLTMVQLELFQRNLEELLRHHYQQHWFPERPCKGSGYRCLRINHKMDPIIAKAGSACGLDEASLRQLFPNELTLWIDPKEVSYRIGENGSICVLYDGTSNHFSESNIGHYFHSMASSQEMGNSYRSQVMMDGHHLSKFPRPSCKDTIRASKGWDSFIMDSRNVGLEQLAAYVSS
ncbi:protein BTG2-like [Centruroides sculpturatus]|uniref:protein BTG2-like n=1 Tax=Centruroides sculpturatus TaxID=218467 RepID=UPI000C6DAF65|nr:protein BTG2-like [Centruroides sculpturatus]XP_023237228.1 protein BTG2-like [Centruroides sculpturatus]